LAGQRHRLAVAQDSPIGARLLRRVTSPAAAAGIGMAFGRGDRRAARGTFGAAVVAVVVCVIAITFAASFAHLKDTPRLYGQTWDYETFGGPPPPKDQMASILHDGGLSDVAAGADSTLTVNGVDTGVRAWDDLKGAIDPTLTAGRRPRGPDEIALGSKTLDQAHAHLGWLVLVGNGARVRRMHVVGRVVLPSSKTNKLGYGGVMTFAALHRVDGGAQRGLLLIGLADGPAGAAAERRLDAIFDENIVVRPDEVGDFGRIDNMPLYIALLAVCAAAAALAHALVSRVRRGRRELAVLKTLGFTRPQVAATIAWQATTILLVAVMLGVPLGAAAGRFTWDVFARDLGVAPDVVIPLVPVLLLVPATVVAGNLLAAVPAWLGARIRPAPVLRTE
jgi:putative ABC transport system permease protein